MFDSFSFFSYVLKILLIISIERLNKHEAWREIAHIMTVMVIMIRSWCRKRQ